MSEVYLVISTLYNYSKPRRRSLNYRFLTIPTMSDIWDDDGDDLATIEPGNQNATFHSFPKDLDKLEEIHSNVLSAIHGINELGRLQGWNNRWTIQVCTRRI